MKHYTTLLLLYLCTWQGIHAQSLLSPSDSLAYSAGILFGEYLKTQGLKNLDTEKLVQALTDVEHKNTYLIDQQTATQYIVKYSSDMRIQESKIYLIDNAKRSEVVSLPSGLQYEIISKCTSQLKPTALDTVTVHYEGRLLDGSIFDSSYKRGEPISFPLSNVIEGWIEGVQLMSVGDKFRFHIPSTLAYGEMGAGNVIPPHATLIFDVELLSINQDQ